jgi:hypothetical protein
MICNSCGFEHDESELFSGDCRQCSDNDLFGFEKIPPYDGLIHQGCLNCPPVLPIADMDIRVCVGFGIAQITKDDEIIYQDISIADKVPTLQEFEKMAQLDPNHDWRLLLEAPLRSREYQRQGIEKWVLIDSGMGFA